MVRLPVMDGVGSILRLDKGIFVTVSASTMLVVKKAHRYDGPNGSLFISILLHNSEFRIPKFALRISEFGIVKYM